MKVIRRWQLLGVKVFAEDVTSCTSVDDCRRVMLLADWRLDKRRTGNTSVRRETDY